MKTRDFASLAQFASRAPIALTVVIAAIALVTLNACTSATAQSAGSATPRASRAPIDLSPVATLPHTAADVRFMSGMVPHHAQAVLMAGWVASRTERNDIRVLAERIIVAQQDEIDLIRNWLRDRNEPDVVVDPSHMMHAGMDDHMMPGMLTAAELEQLSSARGTEFDRLFATFMIRHHEGAITMVEELFASPGAAQDEVVFRFASDVYADQTTEIDRMLTILAILPEDGQS